jgi:Spy/CpxP family protein refolding chaperone
VNIAEKTVHSMKNFHRGRDTMYRSLVAVLVLALGASTLAFGQPYRDRSERSRERMSRRMQPLIESLNLTDEQKTQMHQLRIDKQKQQVQRQSKTQLARIELQELLVADTPDRSAIEKKTKEISDLQHQAKLEMIDHLFKVRSILTPEQQKTFKDHMLRGAGGMQGRRHGMRRGWGDLQSEPESMPEFGLLEEEYYLEEKEPPQ